LENQGEPPHALKLGGEKRLVWWYKASYSQREECGQRKVQRLGGKAKHMIVVEKTETDV